MITALLLTSRPLKYVIERTNEKNISLQIAFVKMHTKILL